MDRPGMTALAPQRAWAIFFRLGGMGTAFAWSFLLAYVMPVAGYGALAFALAALNIGSMIAVAGMDKISAREIPRASGHPVRLADFRRWSFRMVASTGLLFGVAAFLVFTAACNGGIRSTCAAPVAAIAVPLFVLVKFNGGVLQGLGRAHWTAFFDNFAIYGLGLLSAALLLPHLRQDDSGRLTTGLYVGAVLVTWIVSSLAAGSRWPRASRVRVTPDPHARRVWLASVLPMVAVSASALINAQADILLIGMLMSPDATAVYFVATKAAALVAVGLAPINLVIAPRVAHALHRNDKTLARHLAKSAAAWSAMLGLPIAVVLFVGAPLALNLLDPRYADAMLPMVVLILGQLTNVAVGSVGMLLTMAGFERDVAVGIGVGAAANIILNLILIPLYGIVGAAVATMFTTAGWNIFLFTRIRRRLGFHSLAFGR